jgi:hypothetical protein
MKFAAAMAAAGARCKIANFVRSAQNAPGIPVSLAI